MTIILKPLVTEKSMGLVKENLYTFLVHADATKKQIKKAVSQKFDVTVLDVKTVNIGGKTKLQRTRKGYYRTGSFKKAVARLKKGQKIALFESPGETEEVEVRTAEGEVLTKTKEKKSLFKGTKVKISKLSPSEIESRVESQESGKSTKKQRKTVKKEVKKP